jgi:L-ascorbate metabolism protein UlaG (beta-lactamase superfamily)
MDAKQGLEAMRNVDPALAIPIHYNDYDVFTSSLENFQNEVRAAGLADRVHYPRHGKTYHRF